MVRASPLIYLDTQDFIKFRNKPDEEVNREYLTLKRLREAGRIRLGYSALHIWEFITPAQNDHFVKDRTERGQLIVDLCGLNAFPFYGELSSGARYPNSGLWVPRVFKRGEFDTEKIKRETIAKILEERGVKVNRESRRQFTSKKFIRKMIAESDSGAWSREVFSESENPILGVFLKKYFLSYAEGSMSAVQFRMKMVSWMSDPRSFGALWHEFGEGVNPIAEFVYKALLPFQEAIEDVVNASLKVSRMLEDIQAHRAKIVEQAVSLGMNRKRAKAMLPKLPPTNRGPSVTERPSNVDVLGPGRLDHVFHYAEKRFGGFGKFEKSDIVDLMHLVYAPDCDFVRCDRRMFNLFSDFESFSGKLVPSIKDLLERIDLR